MSLDVYLDMPGCEHCGRKGERVASFNHTYNQGGLWAAALEAAGFDGTLGAFLEEHGGDRGRLLETLGAAVFWASQQNLSKYDSPNGWGTGRSGFEFLEKVYTAIKAHPKAVVTVWR